MIWDKIENKKWGINRNTIIVRNDFLSFEISVVFILSYAFFLVQELWPKGKISFKHGCVFPQIHNLNGLFQWKNVPCEFTLMHKRLRYFFFKHENINLSRQNSYYQYVTRMIAAIVIKISNATSYIESLESSQWLLISIASIINHIWMIKII